MVGAGALGEAVWLRSGMDASSMAMVSTLRNTRTVTGTAAALPERSGEVGLVPEYAVLPRFRSIARDDVVLTGTDRTALLRYTWLPTATAVSSPALRPALYRVLMALTSADGRKALDAAGLRRPDSGAPPAAADVPLPQLTSVSFGVMAPHHADHILATWNPEDRRANLLFVVDVSGSMGDPAPGSSATKIALVRQGVLSVAGLLPSDSRLGLWEFGFRLDGTKNYRVLLPPATLDPAHRQALGGAVGHLNAVNSGTALYDTIFAAYRAAQAAYTPGVPNQVLFFTDGRDQDDPNAISSAALSERLRAAADPNRPVEVAMVVFGSKTDTAFLKTVLAPVKGYLEPVATAQQVQGMFVHVAVGGLRTR
jgi:hypothetical protein